MKFLKYKIFCVTDNQYEEVLKLDTDPAPTVCPVNTSHEVSLPAAIASVTDTEVQKVVQVLGDDTITLQPTGMVFSPTVGAVSEHDLLIEDQLCLRGGIMYSANSAIGDWVNILLIDRDNVLGIPPGLPPEYWDAVGFQGYMASDGAPILINYVPKWCLMPNEQNELVDVNIGKLPAAGLVLRVVYHSVGATPVSCVINIISYRGNPA